MSAPSRINGVDRAVLEAACKSKNRYSDHLTAIAIGISQSERYGVKLYTYKCPHCRGWHLTKNGRGFNGNPSLLCSPKIFGAGSDN